MSEAANKEATLEVEDLFEEVVEVEETSLESKEEINLDEILSVEIDQEELSKLEAELYLPKGVYTWVNPPTVKTTYNDTDKKPTDTAQRLYKSTGNAKYNLGRCFVSVSGVVQNKEGKKGRFSFMFSPDYRTYLDKKTNKDSGEGDSASKNYSLLTTFYLEKYESKPKTPNDVLNMLKEANYEMYITLSKAGANFLGKLQKL